MLGIMQAAVSEYLVEQSYLGTTGAGECHNKVASGRKDLGANWSQEARRTLLKDLQFLPWPKYTGN